MKGHIGLRDGASPTPGNDETIGTAHACVSVNESLAGIQALTVIPMHCLWGELDESAGGVPT
jgi:hypothetical protein